jgi:hypothetical protein
VQHLRDAGELDMAPSFHTVMEFVGIAEKLAFFDRVLIHLTL